LDIVEAINRLHDTWEVFGILDDSRPRGSEFEGHKILGGVREAGQYVGKQFVNAIGSDKSFRKKSEIIAQTNLPPERFATLVHPSSSVSSRAKIGPGSCINPGVVLAGGVNIGAHVWLGSGCVIGHDTVIEDYSLIAPRAVISGFAVVGPSAYVGGGASVRQRVNIGEKALVGLGAVVIGDVAAGTTVVGNPARVLVRVQRAGKSDQTPQPRAGLADPPTSTNETPSSKK
jgi:sugar O-acyltransferase (sialic acid O-acetyltransferase NeuD family)